MQEEHAVQLVDAARKARKESPEDDVFWVVYDRESPVKYTDTRHAEARQRAGDTIRIALSNVCFEVWLLLHFQQRCAAYDSCADLLARSDLKRWHPGYDKADRYEYSDGQIEQARANARRLNAETQNGANPEWTVPHLWNPFTDVCELLDAIDDFAKKHKIPRRPGTGRA